MADQRSVIYKCERFRLDDGPGIRTTVFTKGCPLRCLWCSNPESQDPASEIVYNESLCIAGCEECISVCPTKCITRSQERFSIDKDSCTKCYKCVDVCSALALKKVGEIVAVQDLYREIERDILFYNETGGGVTITGGEPLANKDFTLDLLKRCKEGGIHTALDTAGYGEIDDVLPYTDLVLFDIKHMDPHLHKQYTGVSNEDIVENAKIVSKCEVPMIIRVPVVPGLNDSQDNIERVIAFLKSVSFIRVDLLPYHGLGKDKYAQLGRVYQLEGVEAPKKEDLEAIKQQFSDSGIGCFIQA